MLDLTSDPKALVASNQSYIMGWQDRAMVGERAREALAARPDRYAEGYRDAAKPFRPSPFVPVVPHAQV